MKKSFKTIKATMLGIVAAAAVIISARETKADGAPYMFNYQPEITLSDASDYYVQFEGKQFKGMEVKSVKSSDKTSYTDVMRSGVEFWPPKKLGKVTYTFKLSSGKSTIEKKMTVNYYKYVNPLKKAGIVDAKVMKDLNRNPLVTGYGDRITNNLVEKVKFEAKSGWEIQSIKYKEDGTTPEGKSYTVKNNSNFTYKIGSADFVVKVKNKKSGFVETVVISNTVEVNPLQKSSFIDSDAIKKIDKNETVERNVTSDEEKIDIKVKKGWKIKSIKYSYYDSEEQDTKEVKVKNNSVFKYPKKDGTFRIEAKHVKSGYTKSASIYTKSVSAENVAEEE